MPTNAQSALRAATQHVAAKLYEDQHTVKEVLKTAKKFKKWLDKEEKK